MAQINLHTTPELEQALARLMKARGIRSRSEAIRIAVKEAADACPTDRRRAVETVRGSLARFLGDRAQGLDPASLLAEIDEEMEAKLDRLGRR